MPNEQSPLPLQCWETVVTAHRLMWAQHAKNPFPTVPSWLICTAPVSQLRVSGENQP